MAVSPLPLPAKPNAGPVRPTLSVARPRARHWRVLASFVLCVLAPLLATAAYLYVVAADQFASNVGFSVRSEEPTAAIESLLGSTRLSSSTSADTDILYAFLSSQRLVSDLDDALDLRAIWAMPGTSLFGGDPVFAFSGGTIEDLMRHWERMVRVSYDVNAGLLDVRVLAFDPASAQAISNAIFDRSSAMINALSALAREDAIAYAREDLARAQDRLKAARLAVQGFRNTTQIVDPALQSLTQSGLISALETQLAEAQIDLGLLRESGMREGASRIAQAKRRIGVIRDQLAAERAKLGQGNAAAATVADLVGEYEALQVDLEFAQEAYIAARANADAAQSEARRKTRYLAAHVAPSLAQRAEYPRRTMWLGLYAVILFVGWSILVLVAYALRDRR